MGGEIDVGLFAGKAQRKPFLLLAFVFAMEGHADQVRRQIISHPIIHFADDLGFAGADFFL